MYEILKARHETSADLHVIRASSPWHGARSHELVSSARRSPWPVVLAIMALVAMLCAPQVVLAEEQAPTPTSTPAACEGDLARRFESIWARILGEAKGRHPARVELQKIGSSAIPCVLPKVHSRNDTERWEYVNALGLIADPAAADVLIQSIVGDDYLHVRWRALWALKTVNNPDTIKKLRACLDDKDRKRRWNAVVAMSFFKEREVLAALKAGLAAPDSFERWEAANALGRVFDADTSKLLAGLVEDNRSTLNRTLVMSLGMIGDETAITALQNLLPHRDPQVRWRAAMGLEKNDVVSALPLIRAQLARERDSATRELIDSALKTLEAKAGSAKDEVGSEPDPGAPATRPTSDSPHDSTLPTHGR